MAHREATVGDLFPLTAEELSERLGAVIGAGHDQAKTWSGPLRQMIVAEVAKRFGEVLNISLVDIMSGAWCKYAELLQYANGEKYPPEESVIVPLASHEIDSRHAPVIEVVVNGTPILRLTFNVDLVLAMRGAILRIQNATIREIRPGEVDAKGTISFGKIVVAERKSKTLALAGSIDLGAGIPIRSRTTRAAINRGGSVRTRRG